MLVKDIEPTVISGKIKIEVHFSFKLSIKFFLSFNYRLLIMILKKMYFIININFYPLQLSMMLPL